MSRKRRAAANYIAFHSLFHFHFHSLFPFPFKGLVACTFGPVCLSIHSSAHHDHSISNLGMRFFHAAGSEAPLSAILFYDFFALGVVCRMDE